MFSKFAMTQSYLRDRLKFHEGCRNVCAHSSLFTTIVTTFDLFVEYGCMRVKTQIFIYNHTGPISNSTILWKSDREYVLNKYGSQVRIRYKHKCLKSNKV